MIVDRRDVMLLLGGSALSIAASPVTGSVRRDLYLCDGCQAVGERNAASMQSSARLASPGEPGEPMVLIGRVTARDGRPAPGVIIYAHHTDAHGLYSRGSSETEWSRRHGLLRGWVRTDDQGRYAFRTIKPAPYPNRDMPAHVHLFLAEPGRRPYYIDDVVFAGEFRVDARYVAAQELRGGSGIVRLGRDPDGTWIARRDIALERHPE